MSELKPWVVLKFGGTSVSSVSNWHNIARVLRDRVAEGLRPVVVHSALSGITDRLESLLAAAATGGHSAARERIESVHRELAERLSIAPGERFEHFLKELKSLAGQLTEHAPEPREHGGGDDRARARLP